MRGYLVVDDRSLDRVAELTERPRTFWESELIRTEIYNVTLVVFELEGKLVSTVIDNAYNVSFVMMTKFGLEPE